MEEMLSNPMLMKIIAAVKKMEQKQDQGQMSEMVSKKKAQRDEEQKKRQVTEESR
jgi:hypothetical protein